MEIYSRNSAFSPAKSASHRSRTARRLKRTRYRVTVALSRHSHGTAPDPTWRSIHDLPFKAPPVHFLVCGLLLDLDVAAVGMRRHERPDRKSTRLNSSHSSISYAVFCLKKTTV